MSIDHSGLVSHLQYRLLLVLTRRRRRVDVKGRKREGETTSRRQRPPLSQHRGKKGWLLSLISFLYPQNQSDWNTGEERPKGTETRSTRSARGSTVVSIYPLEPATMHTALIQSFSLGTGYGICKSLLNGWRQVLSAEVLCDVGAISNHGWWQGLVHV